ncbi:unnamed protein product [Psylliodes chrysocephalus]|uniref:VWFC domain-containing protein n=1 Tax=Psylliodes chrysocephalus TaxID=3402493 RepID=A0A9P0G5D0_9CUCU|nr:unnamed protein product [Psylliodes chrysocephala]
MRFFIIAFLTILATLTYAEEENCNYQGHLIYEDLGCKPVTKDGHACPVEYTCNFEVKNNTCTFRGRSVQLYEKLTDDDTYAACIIGCHCESTDKFDCAELDCPEWLGEPVKFGCYRKYEVGKCCSEGEICPTESTPPPECLINGVISVEGERYFPANTCLECVCNKGYKGKNEPPFCRNQICAAEAHHSEEIHKYCAPHYGGTDSRVLCCPDGWVCPSHNDKTLPANPKAATSNLKCKYGDKTLKLGERIQGQFKWYDGSLRDSQCECIVPPLMTCRDVPRITPTSTSTTPSYIIETIHD